AATTAHDATVVSDGALPAAASSTTQTTMVHATSLRDANDAYRDKVASIDDRTESIGHAVDDTVITLSGGQSVNLLHFSLAQMDAGFAFDHMPAFDRTDVLAIGHDAVMHGLAPEGGDWILPSAGLLKIDSGTGAVGNEDHGASTQKNLGEHETDD